MTGFAFMRSLFLIFLFPRIIALGRRWTTKKNPQGPPSQECPDNGAAVVSPDELPTSPGEFDAPEPGEQSETEPILPPHHREGPGSSLYVFDLIFLRWSLVVDGAFTLVAAFATKSWHIYLGMFPPLSPASIFSMIPDKEDSCVSPPVWIWLGTGGQGCHYGNVHRVAARRRAQRRHAHRECRAAGHAGLLWVYFCQFGWGG